MSGVDVELQNENALLTSGSPELVAAYRILKEAEEKIDPRVSYVISAAGSVPGGGSESFNFGHGDDDSFYPVARGLIHSAHSRGFVHVYMACIHEVLATLPFGMRFRCLWKMLWGRM